MNHSATANADLASDSSAATALEETACRPFDSAPIQGDQRQSYRYPAQPGREEATIRRGGKTIAAKLAEESAGGIALEVSRDVKLTALEQIEVGIYSGWYVARVIHVRPSESGLRIGLQRIVALSSDGPEKRGQRGGSREASSGMSKFALFFVAGAAMLAGMGLTSWFGNMFAEKSNKRPVNVAVNYPDKPGNDRLKHVLESVNILTKPETAAKLRLTEEQKTSFEGVLVGASNRLGAAYEESKNAPPEVWYSKSQGIINDALENILCSMTDRQIVQWRRLLLEKRNAATEANVSVERPAREGSSAT